jgi:hypothetical protein
MKFHEIMGRIKFSIKLGIVDLSYEPPKPEIQAAHRIITELEDRRVLIDPPFRTDISHCLLSIMQIRQFLKEELKELSVDSKLKPSLQAMTSACRSFLNKMQEYGISTESTFDDLSLEQSSHFHIGLGELRRTFGMHLAVVAAQYRLDIHDDLASILPDEEEV